MRLPGDTNCGEILDPRAREYDSTGAFERDFQRRRSPKLLSAAIRKLHSGLLAICCVPAVCQICDGNTSVYTDFGLTAGQSFLPIHMWITRAALI